MAWFQVSFFSACHMRSVPINILIPVETAGPIPGVAGIKRFKTLYLLNGYMGNQTDWLLNAQIQEMSIDYNLAVVMPAGLNNFYIDAPRSGFKGSEYIGDELISFTRRVFPLSDKREDTLLGGLSMGSYGTIYNSLKYGNVFGHAIALSAPISLKPVLESTPEAGFMGINRGYYESIHGDLTDIMDTDSNLKHLAKRVLDEGRPIPDLYIACGYNDMLVRDNREFSGYLNSIGFPHVYEEGPGSHEWAFWNQYLRRGLMHAIPNKPSAPHNPLWIEKD